MTKKRFINMMTIPSPRVTYSIIVGSGTRLTTTTRKKGDIILSRKSMIYKKLDILPEFALNATTAVHAWALERGAKILRVHDVKEAKECITLWETLQ